MKENKVLLLIGASGGLGNKIIPMFHKAGYKLALHYKSSHTALEQTICNYSSRECKIYQADITNEKDVSRLIYDVKNDFGRIDVLINAAGVTASGMSWKTQAEDWKRTLAINLTGPFFTIKHVLPVMREQQFGRIINISSIVAQKGMVGTSAYAASKSGLIGLVKSISKEVADKDVTVNNIALGYFDAGMIDTVPADILESIKSEIPKKSLGDPLELAECILYLSGNKSSYITGQTINLNGGLYA